MPQLITHQEKNYIRISSIGDKGHYDNIHPHILDRAKMRGSQVHQAIEDELMGTFGLCEPIWMGYVESWRKWKSHTDFVPYKIEERYFNDELMITGKIDLIADIDGIKYLFDWKTASTRSPQWEIQQGLYALLLREAQIQLSPYLRVIQLSKDGTLPKVHTFEMNDSLEKRCLREVKIAWDKVRKREEI